MFCTECGKGLPTESAHFCPSCGSPQAAPSIPQAVPHEFVATEPVVRKSGQGMGTAGLITGIIGLVFGLYDYNLLQGTFDYLVPEEIGILFILSALGVAFSSVGVSRKSTLGTWGLVISLLSLFLTFYLASFS